MKMLFVTHAGDPGGAEFTLLAVCRSMRESAEVLLLQHGSFEKVLQEQKIRYSVHELGADAHGVRRGSGLLGVLRAIPAAISGVARMARIARRFDVVVCFSQKAFVIAALAKSFSRRPIVWFMNDILTTDHFSPLMIRMVVSLARVAADQVALVSQEAMDEWIRAGGRRRGASVVISGIDSDEIARQLEDRARVASYRARFTPDGRPLIGMFGRICRWKGQDVFLRAMAQVPGARAIVVGGTFFEEREFEQELKQLVGELGLADRVEFVGHVEDPITVMAACDVVAHCSTAPEPSGRVITEAMFAGVPVIGSNAGGVPEFIVQNETGQLTPLNDHAALAAAIRRYLDDPGWSREVAAKAQRRAEEKYSARATLSGFHRAIESL
jgi:glycosyltransferase involved in cell wall biosynthesis